LGKDITHTVSVLAWHIMEIPGGFWETRNRKRRYQSADSGTDTMVYGGFVAGDGVGVGIQDIKLPSNSFCLGIFGIIHKFVWIVGLGLRERERERERETHTQVAAN
jgi:hypothetical protein